MTTYQVVAECAHATIRSPFGTSVQLLLKGALVPADAPQLKHLLDNGFVVAVDSGEAGGVDASGIPAGAYTTDVPAGLTTTPALKTAEQVKADSDAAEKSKADAEVAERRAAAREKLPEDGSAPDGRVSKEVHAEWLAARGLDYGEVMKLEPAEVKALVKQESQK